MTDVMPILEQMEFVEKEVFRVLMQGHADRMALFKAVCRNAYLLLTI